MISWARSSMAASGIVALIAAQNLLAAEPPAVAELLKMLNLGGYSSRLQVPDFSGPTADRKTASLVRLRGQVILLNFWATWCLECRTEMYMFERWYREFSAQGLSIIGINAREGTVAIREYSKELGLTFPLVLDPLGEINVAYGVIGLPTTFLIGRDGRAVALAVGPKEWASAPARALIQRLLAEPNTLKSSR